MTALRVLVALVAALMVAWFAVLLRDERIGSEASDQLFQPRLSDAGWRRSMDRFRQAEFLNPDVHWAVTRAGLLLPRDASQARREAEVVIRREPDNIDAWAVVYEATQQTDPRRAAEAVAAIHRLNPFSGVRGR